MTSRARGRPPADGKTVSPQTILAQALSILDAGGLPALTMRALATRVGINPMTIYYHFKDRDGLIKALAEQIYADISAPETGDAHKRMHGLLNAYYGKVVLHPALTLAIFAKPEIFPNHAKRITNEMAHLLGDLGLDAQRSRRWTHILVDYTHGAALAVAARQRPTDGTMLDEFDSAIGELLQALG